MAGIFGIYDPDGRMPKPQLRSMLQNMAKEFAEPEWHTVTGLSNGLGIGCAIYPGEELNSLPARFPGNRLLASSGSFMHVADEIVSQLSRDDLNRKLGALQEEAGPENLFSRKLEGRFAIVSGDLDSRTLHVGVDRFGLYPLYYHAHDGMFWFSTRLAAIYRVCRAGLSYDHDSIADFLAHKHFIGNSTYFNEIQIVPEGSYVTFREGHVTVRRYWQHKLEEDPAHTLGPDEAVTNLRQAWNRAMDSCAKAGRTDGVALSGGLDSRAITAALVGRGKNVVTYTFGDPNCNDVKYARMVTKKLNIPHFSASLDQAAFVYQDTDTILRRSDGSLPLNHSHPISLAPYMRNTADTFFDGLTGEVLGAVGLNRHRKTRVTAETAPATLMKHFMLFGDELVRKAMPGVTPAAQRIDRYGYYYSDFGGHKHGTSVVNIWSDVSRQRRFVVNQPRLLEGERRVYCPFWNFDYYQVCSSLPPSDRRLMRPWVILNRKEYPDLVHVPWTRWSLPLWTPIKVGESLINVHELMTYTNYFVHRFTGIRPLGGFQSGFSFYFDWFRVNPTLKAFIQEVLSDPIVDRIPFLSRQGVMAIVDTHMNNITVNYADLIGSLMATVLYIDRCESTPTI